MIEPRWYQTAANAAVWEYLKNTSGNPMIVLPTGAGKSLTLALVIQQALEFGARIVVLAHRKELLEQNRDEILEILPTADVGIYSAGLKSKQIHNRIVVAGIQSVFRKAADFGERRLVIVDEAHLVSDLEDTMYRKFLGDIAKLNPGLRIVGLSATPSRTGTGPICGPDRIFQRIVFEAQTGQLIEQGFLCPITNKSADKQVNTDKVGLRGGEFIESELQAVFDVDDVVEAACKEILEKCHDRHSILIFASGVSHAEKLAAYLPGAAIVTGETLPIERASILQRFKSGELRFVVNVDVLTTGFNARNIDAIAILRATMSPGLFCQMVGRGLRKHESKENCLLLDFGQNIARHGSIDDSNFGRSEGRVTTGKRDAIAATNGRGKTCPRCGLDVAANSRTCPECNFLFPVNHEATADEESQLTGQKPPEIWNVESVVTKVHTPKRDPESEVIQSVRIDYFCRNADIGGDLKTQVISEWICPAHQGFARRKFEAWWEAHSICDTPDTASDCNELLSMGVARWPIQITTKQDGKWFRILSQEFGDRQKPTELSEPEESKVFSGEGDDCPF